MFNTPVPAAMIVLPEPLMAPLGQLRVPLIVTSLLPASVPLESCADGKVTAELHSTVPPLTVSEEPPVNGPLNVALPPEKVFAPVRLTCPAALIVPPMTCRSPAPLRSELALKVCGRFRISAVPLATAKSLLCEPPPCKPRVPACTSTAPLLLKLTVVELTKNLVK